MESSTCLLRMFKKIYTVERTMEHLSLMEEKQIERYHPRTA